MPKTKFINGISTNELDSCPARFCVIWAPRRSGKTTFIKNRLNLSDIVVSSGTVLEHYDHWDLPASSLVRCGSPQPFRGMDLSNSVVYFDEFEHLHNLRETFTLCASAGVKKVILISSVHSFFHTQEDSSPDVTSSVVHFRDQFPIFHFHFFDYYYGIDYNKPSVFKTINKFDIMVGK